MIGFSVDDLFKNRVVAVQYFDGK